MYFTGFSGMKTNTTWLPVHPNYYYLNVECQKQDETSHLKVYKALTKLRSNNDVFQRGDFKTSFKMSPVSEWVLAFKR